MNEPSTPQDRKADLDLSHSARHFETVRELKSQLRKVTEELYVCFKCLCDFSHVMYWWPAQPSPHLSALSSHLFVSDQKSAYIDELLTKDAAQTRTNSELSAKVREICVWHTQHARCVA